jgi:hypothetical protein
LLGSRVIEDPINVDSGNAFAGLAGGRCAAFVDRKAKAERL